MDYLGLILLRSYFTPLPQLFRLYIVCFFCFWIGWKGMDVMVVGESKLLVFVVAKACLLLFSLPSLFRALSFVLS
jgi:hypothetical protein